MQGCSGGNKANVITSQALSYKDKVVHAFSGKLNKVYRRYRRSFLETSI